MMVGVHVIKSTIAWWWWWCCRVLLVLFVNNNNNVHGGVKYTKYKKHVRTSRT